MKQCNNHQEEIEAYKSYKWGVFLAVPMIIGALIGLSSLFFLEKETINIYLILFSIGIEIILIGSSISVIGAEVYYRKKYHITKSEYLDIRKEKREKLQQLRWQNASLTSQSSSSKYLSCNNESKSFTAFEVGLFGAKTPIATGKFEDIIDVEIIDDGISVLKGGLGSAVVGDILAGPVGSICGSIIGKKSKSYSDKMSVNITMASYPNLISIPLIQTRTKIDGIVYKTQIEEARRIVAELRAAYTSVAKKTNNSNEVKETDIPELLEKYKKLYDSGIITETDYNEKKKQLLNL